MTTVRPPTTPATLLADDNGIESLVGRAELPALLPALAHLAGDLTLELRPPLRLRPDLVEPQGGMSEQVQALARERAAAALRAYRDGGCEAAPEPDADTLRRLMSFVTGEVADDQLPMLAHELGMPVDAGAPGWTVEQIAPGRTVEVVVIGAGMSGLVSAHRLTRAGVGVTVLERNADVGGVWLENSYPGARLDTPNVAYSFSFAPQATWRHQFRPRRHLGLLPRRRGALRPAAPHPVRPRRHLGDVRRGHGPVDGCGRGRPTGRRSCSPRTPSSARPAS